MDSARWPLKRWLSPIVVTILSGNTITQGTGKIAQWLRTQVTLQDSSSIPNIQPITIWNVSSVMWDTHRTLMHILSIIKCFSYWTSEKSLLQAIPSNLKPYTTSVSGRWQWSPNSMIWRWPPSTGKSTSLGLYFANHPHQHKYLPVHFPSLIILFLSLWSTILPATTALPQSRI